MADMTLYVGNKNYSSWSLRPWLALRQAGLEFDEVVIPLDEAATSENIRRHSPSGRVPVLRHGELTVWESLSICEYASELAPEAGLWPADRAARAVARSAASEMHAGFAALRGHFPMNMRSSFPDRGASTEAQADINRVTALWRDCRKRFGEGGPFLFGAFSIVDAMFAPVVSRFRTYKIDLDEVASAYVEAVWSLPALQDWVAAARKEPMVIPYAEF